MNKLVKENYPVSQLPEDLRRGLDSSSSVTVTVQETLERPERVMTLEEIWASRTPPFRSKEDIDADLRRERDSWSDGS